MKLHGDGPLVLVDDSVEDIFILRRCFERSQLADRYGLHTVESGMDFLDHMRLVEAGLQPLPSIALLDINMPVMNGFEALEQLRALERFRDIPAVVFVSNSDSPRDVKRAEELGAGFVEKFASVDAGVAFFDALLVD